MNAVKWNNQDLAKCLCWDVQADDWCDSNSDRCSDYSTSLWPQGIAFSVTGLVILVLGVGYLVVRLLSCLLLPTRLCCKKHPVPGNGAYILRASMLAVLLLYAAFAAPLTVYRSKVSDGVNALNGTLTDGTNEMRSRMQNFTQGSLEMAELLSATDLVAQPVLKAHSDVRRWTDDINKKQKNALAYQAGLDLVWWLLPLLFIILFALALFNVHRVAPEVFFVFIFSLAVVLTSVQLVFAVAGEVTVDLCGDFSAVSDQMDLIMQSNLECGSVNGSLGEIPSTLGVLSRVGEERTAGNVTSLCKELFQCGSVDGNSSVSVLGNVIYNQSSLVNSDSSCLGCSIATCASQCTSGSAAQTASLMALNLFIISTTGVESLAAVGSPLANCSVYRDIITNSQKPFCEGRDSLSSTLPVYGGVAIGCTVMAMFMVLMNTLMSYVYTRPGQACEGDCQTASPLLKTAPEVNSGSTVPTKHVYGSCEDDPSAGNPSSEKTA